MVDVLRTTSPTHLEILHTDYPHIWASSVFTSPLAFPNLIELRIIGTVLSSSLSDMHISPALQKLCISGPKLCCVRHGETQEDSFGEMLNRACPNLTHLRFTPPISPPTGEAHFDFVHKYCRVSRSQGDIISSPLQFVTDVEDYDDIHFVAAGSGSDNVIPTRLHCIIIDRPPCIPDATRNTYASSHGNRFPLEGVWHPDHFTVLKAYKALAVEAKRENGVREEEDPEARRRSLKVLGASSYVRRADRFRYALEEFARFKTEWAESVAGMGPGCWI